MQPSTRFKALRSDPEDDTYQNVNTDSRELPSDKLPYCANNERKFTFRERMSTFPWRPFLIVALLPLALAPIIALAASAETASRNYIFRRNCYPNGLWWNSPGATWKIMDSSYFFIPNLSFGTMTFTQVKVIDIAWDLTVGRGGQVLLAWVNYRVFNEWLVYHMECHLTSYKLYASVAFKTTSVSTLGVLGKEFLAYGKGTWKRFFRWLAILSMFLSTLYVLSFPTLMAAMTGYISIFEPYVEDYNNNLIKASKVDLVWCVINDAHRIGYEKPLLVGQDNKNLTTAVQSYIKTLNVPIDTTTLDIPGTGDIYFHVNTTSTWTFNGQQVTLPSPSLNFTLYRVNYSNGMWFWNPFWYAIDGPQSSIYSQTYIADHTSCKPGEKYQWGFSYIFLFMVSIFNFVWSCIMVAMWLDTRRRSRVYRSGRRPGLLRSIIEYSAAIREEIGKEAEDLEEEELRERLREGGTALVVPEQELRIRRVDTRDEGLRERGWKKILTRGSTF